MREYIDVLIPRGGADLIKTVVETSRIPVIETGTGNCHVYVEEDADFEKATPIVINAKCQRPGTCNAAEKLLVHGKIAKQYLPVVIAALRKERRGSQRRRRNPKNRSRRKSRNRKGLVHRIPRLNHGRQSRQKPRRSHSAHQQVRHQTFTTAF